MTVDVFLQQYTTNYTIEFNLSQFNQNKIEKHGIYINSNNGKIFL